MKYVYFIAIFICVFLIGASSDIKPHFTNTYNPRVFSYSLKKEESDLFSIFVNSSQDEFKEMVELDGKLCAAARYNSLVYSKKGEIPKKVETTALRPLLWSYGVYDFLYLPTIFIYKSPDNLKDSIKAYSHLVSKRGFYNCGIGIANFQEEKKIATIICSKRVIETFDIPKIVSTGSYISLNFSVRQGYKEPLLCYSPPSGGVTKKRPAVNEKGEYFDSYQLDGGVGKYLIQIIVKGQSGAEPVFLIPVYSGVDIDDIKKELQIYINLKDNTKNVSVEEARGMVLKAINYERKKIHLNPVRLNPVLSQIAYEKSKMMAEKQLFGHEVGNIKTDELLKKHKIKFGKMAENIGLNSSPRMAHFLFMSSPVHRANILESAYSEVGLGIYKAGDEEPQWFITEIFIMPSEL